MAGYALGFDDGGDVPQQGIPDDESAGLDTSANARDSRLENDRPWYREDSGMLPVRAAKEFGRRAGRALHGMTQGPEEGHTLLGDIQEGNRALGEFDTDQTKSLQASWNRGLENVQKNPVVAGSKRVIAYLMGEGADHPQRAQAAAAQVKANDPNMSDDDANLLAVKEAAENSGPDAAWALMQSHRVAYNAKQAFAQAALTGTDGKPADIQAAAQAATQAGSHVLDGSQTIFTATGPNAVTATVKGPDGQTKQYPLTAQQFADYLDVGKTGQFDRQLMGGGIGATLAKITGQATGSDNNPASPDADVSASGNASATPSDTTTPPAAAATSGTAGKDGTAVEGYGTVPEGQPLPQPLSSREKADLRGYRPMDYDAFNDEKSTSQARATQLFPHANAQDAAQRARYITTEEEREAQGNIKKDVARLEGEKAANVAGIRAKALTDITDTKVAGQKDVAATTTASKEKIAGLRYGAMDRKTEADRAAKMAALAQKKAQFDAQRGDKLAELKSKNLARIMGNINAGFTSGDTKRSSEAGQELDRYTAQLGITIPQAPTPQAPTPQAPQPSGNQGVVTVQSLEEAHALAPGTPYRTPDGRKFTR